MGLISVTLSVGGALTDDGVNQITAEYLTVESASSIGEVYAGLTIDASLAKVKVPCPFGMLSGTTFRAAARVSA